ncbi:hypothetical protein [Treponema sp.]|uniref:hypothetical protein n=1 Tax=Treponema sp. TaxID=166 RepID=UPI00298E5781|nr:hypothetical protein [Treponema sp.]MCR5614140.1 hypothetical protein [Treponema sp.]
MPEDKIQGMVINGTSENQKTLVFEIDDRQYDLFIDSSDDNKYYKLFITVKEKNSQNIYHVSSSFIENEIISENDKNDNGFSIKYNLASKESKLYTIPLSFDQLDFENVDGQLLMLPPDF